MKKALRILSVIILTTCLFSLGGCVKYATKRNATGLVHKNTSTSGHMTFSSFSGTMVFKMKYKGEDVGKLKYSAKLESGSATVYYDSGGTKKELFSIAAGENVDSSGGELVKGTVYVLVESSEKCQNGEFSFNIE